MHLQASVEGYDVFARSLSIGAETMVMNFDPDQPMHGRYSVSHDFLSPETGAEVVSIGRIVNAFFRWEFNSCETLVAGTRGLPDRLRQRLPGRRDHVAALLLPVGHEGARAGGRCSAPPPAASRRRTSTRRRGSRSPTAPTCRTTRSSPPTRQLADDYFDTERYRDFCASRLGALDELALAYFESARLRPGARRDGHARRSRRTSTSSSSRTTAACSRPGAATSEPRPGNRPAGCEGRALHRRPGVHRLVGVHVVDVLAQHLAQRVGPVACPRTAGGTSSACQRGAVDARAGSAAR